MANMLGRRVDLDARDFLNARDRSDWSAVQWHLYEQLVYSDYLRKGSSVAHVAMGVEYSGFRLGGEGV